MSERVRTEIKFTAIAATLGDSLLESTLDRIKRAISKSYPSLSDEDKVKLVTTPDRIVFEPLPQVLEREDKLRDIDNIQFFSALTELGVPRDEVRALWCWSSPRFPYSWNPLEEQPVVYIDQKVKEAFDDKENIARRTRAMAKFAFDFINANLITLSYSKNKQPLPCQVWMKEVKKDFYGNLLPDLTSLYLQGDPILSSQLIDKVELFKSPEEEFDLIPLGPAVLCVKKGNTKLAQEYSLGVEFFISTIEFLADPIRREFVQLLRNGLLIPNVDYKTFFDWAFGDQDRSRTDKMISSAKGVLGGIGLSTPQATMPIFIEGGIPPTYHRYIVSRIGEEMENPYEYGQKIVTSEYALDRYLERVICGIKSN